MAMLLGASTNLEFPRVSSNPPPHPPIVAESEGVTDKVEFIRSFTDDEKVGLLNSAVAILYTPTNEHFGIVPIECMAAHKPVVACNSGGPMESVANGKTGFLCEASGAKSEPSACFVCECMCVCVSRVGNGT